MLFNDRVTRMKCSFWSHTLLIQEFFSQRGMMGIALCGTWPEESKSAPILTWWDLTSVYLFFSVPFTHCYLQYIHTEADQILIFSFSQTWHRSHVFFLQPMLFLYFLCVSLSPPLLLALFFFFFCFLSTPCWNFLDHLIHYVRLWPQVKGRKNAWHLVWCTYTTAIFM